MKAHLAYIRYKLGSSLWFIPGLMVVGAIGLSFAMVALDRALLNASISMDWMYNATPDGARQLLTTIASSTITVTSLVFSMTLISLTLASQQLGPRLLENFMRNKPNQFVLGFFVATFVYALLVLRTVSELNGAHFVPTCATVVAIVMSIISFAILIFFIHHVAGAIQADAVIANVSENLEKLIARNFVRRDADEDVGLPPNDEGLPDNFDAEADAVCATQSGYIQTLDVEALKALAIDQQVVLQIECRPGHFVVEGFPVAHVFPTAKTTDDVRESILSHFVIGTKRTPAQDIEYGIRVISEIAIRALSSGINDQYTAVTCVDRMTAALILILQRDFPASNFCDDDGNIILRTVPSDFEGLLDTAFNDIRQSARGSTAVTIRLLESLSDLALVCRRNDQMRAIAKHVEMVGRGAAEFIFDPHDKSDVEERLRRARRHMFHEPLGQDLGQQGDGKLLLVSGEEMQNPQDASEGYTKPRLT